MILNSIQRMNEHRAHTLTLIIYLCEKLQIKIQFELESD